MGANREVQKFLESHESSLLKTAASLAELLCRPELSYEILEEIDKDRKELPPCVLEQVEIEIKYEGYIVRQKRQVEQFQPASIGQASRISGVSPADISVLLVYLEKFTQ